MIKSLRINKNVVISIIMINVKWLMNLQMAGIILGNQDFAHKIKVTLSLEIECCCMSLNNMFAYPIY